MVDKKVLLRLPRIVVDEDTGRKIVLNELEEYFIPVNKDFHGNGFVVKQDLLEKNGFFSVGKDSFAVFPGSFNDFFRNIKRKAQIITPKDLGSIIAYTGIGSDSVVMDAGSGSGSSACFLSRFAGKVFSFDVNEENLAVARKNASFLGLDNVFFEEKDVYDEDSFKEGFCNVFLLDVPEPSKAVGTAKKVLKQGGFFVVYAPHISQVQEVVKVLPKNFVVQKTIEVIERDWNVSEKSLRPATKDFGHTGFLCFIRKVF